MIIYFGIGRGGRLAESHYKNWRVLKADSIHCYIDQKYVKNQRSGEDFDVSKLRILLANNCIKIEEEEVEDFLELQQLESFEDQYADNHASIKNLLRQLYMLNKVCSEIKAQYHRYLFVRDDTISEFDFEVINKLDFWDEQKPNILVPSAHWHGGICDRFFLTNKIGLEKFRERLTFSLKELQNASVSSERIFHKFLSDSDFNIYANFISVRRIRRGVDLALDRYWIPIHRPREFIRVLSALLRFYWLK